MIRNIFGNGDAEEELKLVYFTHFSGETFFLAKYLTIMHAFELFHLQKQRVFKIFIIVVFTTEFFFLHFI